MGLVISGVATLGAVLYILLVSMSESEKHGIAIQKFTIHEAAQEVPEIYYINDDEQLLTLKHFGNKTILLNIWATWCPPCVEEMPTLDRLQAELGSDGFEVVALSIDQSGIVAVKKFYNKIGVKNLQVYVDDSTESATLLNTYGLPSTLLINEKGLELGRLIGPMEWDSLRLCRFCERLLNRRNKPVTVILVLKEIPFFQRLEGIRRHLTRMSDEKNANE